MKMVQESPKLKKPNSFQSSFQIFFFSKEDRLMPIDEYREYFNKSSNWNKNKDKRSKDDYLKILVKDSMLVNHTIPPKDVEQTLENKDQDNIIYSEKQQKELDEIQKQKLEEEKRKQEEELKALEEKKNDSIAEFEKESKKQIKKKEKLKKKKDDNEPVKKEKKDESESKNKNDK